MTMIVLMVLEPLWLLARARIGPGAVYASRICWLISVHRALAHYRDGTTIADTYPPQSSYMINAAEAFSAIGSVGGSIAERGLESSAALKLDKYV